MLFCLLYERLNRLQEEERRCLTARLKEERQVKEEIFHLSSSIAATTAVSTPPTSTVKREVLARRDRNTSKTQWSSAALPSTQSDAYLRSFLAQHDKILATGTSQSPLPQGGAQVPAWGGRDALHDGSDTERGTARITGNSGELETLFR